MDHSVKVMNSHRKVAFTRLFSHRRFESKELEQLYRRYIFKLQQSSIVSALILLACLSISIALVQICYRQSANMVAIYCLIQFVVFMGLFTLSFRMHDTQLLALCYVILLFCVLFCLLMAPIHFEITHWNSPLSWWKVPPQPSLGVWPIVFVVFITYTMLPIKVSIVVLFSSLLCGSHVAVTMNNVTSYVNDVADDSSTYLDLQQHYIRQQVKLLARRPFVKYAALL